MSYKKNYENWQNNPISFWQEKAEDISWYKKPKKILDTFDAPFVDPNQLTIAGA